MENILAIKYDTQAILPTRATPLSAGLDLYSTKCHFLPPHQTTLIDIGIGLQLPKSTFGLISGRSSLYKSSVHIAPGIIDADYQLPVIVIATNHSDTGYFIAQHQRIAQIIVIPCQYPSVLAVDTYDRETSRIGGFGSTGRFGTFKP